MATAVAAWSVHTTRHSPPLSVGGGAVPTVLGGLDDVLYRDAEARRWRQQSREEEALERERQNRIPRLGRASRALCQGRLERELKDAFEQCGCAEDFYVQRDDLHKVLEALGLLSRGGAESEEDTFCAKLALLLDKDNCGAISFESLLSFLLKAEDVVRDGDQPRARSAQPEDLAEVCFAHLEQQLSKAVGRLLVNRLNRPRSSSAVVSPSTDNLGEGGASSSSAPSGTARRRAPSVSSVTSGTSGIGYANDSGEGYMHRREEFSERPCTPRRRARAASTCAYMGHGNPSAPSSPAVSQRAARAPSQGTPVALPRPQSARRPRGSGSVDDGSSALSRCHLLYHQAVFASRESTQLCQEIKSLREKEEMRECTFRPKMFSTRRPPSPAPAAQPRNFESAVARMRKAQFDRAAKKQAVERIPRGENYERLRRLGVQPFSLYYKAQERVAAKRGPALLFVDVNVGHGRTGRIGVHEGDDLRVLARNFARAFQLDCELEQRLEQMLHQACEERRRRDLHENDEYVNEEQHVAQAHYADEAFEERRRRDLHRDYEYVTEERHVAQEQYVDEAPSVLDPLGFSPHGQDPNAAYRTAESIAEIHRSSRAAWHELLTKDDSVAVAACEHIGLVDDEADAYLSHRGVEGVQGEFGSDASPT